MKVSSLILGGVLLTSACLRPELAQGTSGSLTTLELRQLFSALAKRAKPNGVNYQHSRRLYYYAPAFAEAAGARLDLTRAAAILHDSTKEDGKGAPKDKFCTHGAQGAQYRSGGLLPWDTADACAGMGTGPAEEQPVDR